MCRQLSPSGVARQHQRRGGAAPVVGFGKGLRLYLRRYPWETILSFLWLPLALLAWLRPVRALGPVVSIAAGYLGLHYLAYTILNVPPYHWYYVPEAVSLLLLGTLALATLLKTGPEPLLRHHRY